MKPLEKPMADKQPLFSIGSALDKEEGWRFEEEKSSSSSIELKLPAKHFLVLKMDLYLLHFYFLFYLYFFQ